MSIGIGAGTAIGERYRLERLLGEGGMGAVWAAEDTATGRRCALKLMKDPADDPEARKRFLREGRAAAAVRHPNVVSILDVLEPEGEPPAIVMELLEGEPLRARLGRGQRLLFAELADIMVSVVSAVGAAHGLGIVHRDLKPENIFLARGAAGERVVKVLDFGIAKLTALDGEAMRSTGITTGAVLGTPAYMAPEQVFAEKDLDHRADIWALGVILYECLSGVCPTKGDNVGQVLKHVVARPFEPLSALVPDLPDEIARLIARMLAREPSLRPADLHEVLERLEPFASTPGVPFGPPAPHLAAPEPLAKATRNGAADPIAPRDRRYVGAVDSTAPPPRRRRRRVVMGGAIVAGIAVVAGQCLLPGGVSPAPPSPLDPPDAKLACPILRASGVDPPAGWLGAAAAAVACERARVILGGRPERTLVPAELLDLPREPRSAFPADPYATSEARKLSVTAAQERAQAYLDGEVVRSFTGFAVTLSLHGADGNQLKRSSGQGRGLYEAVRSAMLPLVGPGLLPKASELAPKIAAWSRTRDVDAALSVLDLRFARAHNAGGLPDECRRFDQQSDRVQELAPLMRWYCAYTLGQRTPDIKPDVIDKSTESPEAVATKIRIRYFLHPAHDDGDDVDFLRRLADREETSWGRSLLAATESCLVQSKEPERAYELALAAVRSEPKNPDGEMCNPWGQLMTVTRDKGIAQDAIRAMQAWAPWNSHGWLFQGLEATDPDAALLPLRRAYALTPFNTRVANALADKLLLVGRREDARRIAFELRSSNFPVHHVASKLIQLRVDASEAQLGKALAQAQEAFQIRNEDAGWVRAQRFEVAWQALEVAAILGRTSELADVLVQRFLDPDPPVLDGFSEFRVPDRIPAVCTLASVEVSARCVARFRKLRPLLPAGITSGTDALLDGAERYAKRDLAGAARAWRPLLRGPGILTSGMTDAMVKAFEHTGEIELAERVDADAMLRAREFNGATLGHVRAARRARARGDLVKARALAQQVIDAWSMADETIPAVAEMRQLIEQLRDRRP